LSLGLKPKSQAAKNSVRIASTQTLLLAVYLVTEKRAFHPRLLTLDAAHSQNKRQNTQESILIQTSLSKYAARLLAVVLLGTAFAGSQDTSSSVKAEIDRLQQSLKDKPVSNPDMPDLATVIETRLKDAGAALSAGRLYLSLERLGEAEDYLQGLRMVDEKAAAIKDSLPAFESEWGKASVQLTAQEKAARAERLEPGERRDPGNF